MVSIGNVKRTGVQAPPPPGQQHVIKAAGVASPAIGHQGTTQGNQTSPKLPTAANKNSEVLNQTRKFPYRPAKVAVGGLAFVASLAYFTLYTKKKPEASALDVAKVTTGTSIPENTRPRE